jgi:ParB-like nuclease domain
VRSPKQTQQNIAAETASLKGQLSEVLAALALLVNAVSVGDRGSYTLKDFQRRHNLSQSQFFKLCREGRGPRAMSVGSVGKRVSREAERDWIAAREIEAEAAAKETAPTENKTSAPEEERPQPAANGPPTSRRMRITSRRAVEQQAFRRIDEIVIGRRHHREMGDIAALAASVRDDTQLQPIVIRSAGALISGARRSQTAKLLGLTKLSVAINDRVDPRRGAFAGNVHRKSFTSSELVVIGAHIELIDRRPVNARKVHNGLPEITGMTTASANDATSTLTTTARFERSLWAL